MPSVYIDQDGDGPVVSVIPELAPWVRQALFESAIPFREEAEEAGGVRFHVDESTPRSTLYRALEAVL